MITAQKSTLSKNIRKIGTLITTREAQEMISAWQSQEPDAVFSFLYGRHVFDKILAAPQCEGIRVFNGINDEELQALVLIGVDAAGKYIFSYKLKTPEGFIFIEDPIGDKALQCPPYCPKLMGTALETGSFLGSREGSLDLGKVGGSITREEAQKMITAWQTQEPDAVFSFLYGREVFDTLLALPGCAGIRVFNGINAKGRQALVFAAVDAKGDNILQYKVNTNDGIKIVNAPLADDGVYCPYDCPERTDLGDYIWNS